MISGPDTFPGKVAATFQIDAKMMIKYFCKPRIKVGTEWVTKGQSCEQVRAIGEGKKIHPMQLEMSKTDYSGNWCCGWHCPCHL